MTLRIRAVGLLLLSLTLASCGGGGGDGGSAQPPQLATLSVTPAQSTIALQSSTDIAVIAKKGDGTPVAEGTTVSVQLSPGDLATISVAGSTTGNATASGTSVGGRVNFTLRSLAANGTVHITASMSDPNTPARTVTATADVVISGPPPQGNLSATANPSTITRNSHSDITATLSGAGGAVPPDGSIINASVSPSGIGTIPSSGSTVGGHALFVFNSANLDGTATITLSAIDPADSSRTLTTTVTVVVANAAPATLTVTPASQTIAKNAVANLLANLRRANGDVVTDGTTINAVLTPASIGTVSGAGAPGSTASNTTVGGLANFRFNSTAQTGVATITLSAIDPDDSTRTITATATVTVDGNLAPQMRLKVEPATGTTTKNSIYDLLVTLIRNNGDPVADGTTINALVTTPSLGAIRGSGAAATTATNTTTGGRSTFQFISGNNAGNASVTVSAVDPDNAGQTLTATASIVVSGNPQTGIQIIPAQSSISQNSSSDIAVIVTNRLGQPIADGTSVNLIVTPSSIGNVASGPGQPIGNQATGTTVGGRTNFVFSSLSVIGNATLTASVADPDNAGATISASATIAVVAGTNPPRLSATATATLLPPNILGVAPFIGSPYIAEVDITWRRANGQLVNGSTVGVSVNPVTYGGFGTLDDPATTDIDEFTSLLGQGPVDVVAGHATVFFNAFATPGNTTMTITAVDPDTHESLQTQVVFTIAAISVPLPATVAANAQTPTVYVTGSGGNNSTLLVALVSDGAGQPVPDPASGNTAWNNVVFTINNADQLGGAKLSAVNAAGTNVSGTSVKTRTVRGQATATFAAGTVAGNVTITVTADRADNNVDNNGGVISDPVNGTAGVVVSDGKLYSIVLTSPTPNAIQVNPVDGTAGPATGETVPPQPNGTYSLTVSALATDRQGNPVVPNTTLRFGVIDAPLFGFPDLGHGMFYLTGTDGNPKEGDSLFTAPSGQFTTAGGGAGPGDTLLVFGQLVPGNRDLQESRQIQTVSNATSLNILGTFNRNDDTGVSVDSGAVLPYVIGRATEANIGASARTNAVGVATVTLNYPVSRLGKANFVWAQGDSSNALGAKKVTGTAGYTFPGAAPAAVTASTDTVLGNTSTQILVCFNDANAEPLQGFYIGFNFHDLGSGSGTVDGNASGVTQNPTGSDGCTSVIIVTSGITSDDSDAGVVFSIAGATPKDVAITVGSTATNLINVAPTSMGSNGGPVQINVRDASGNPLAGVPIAAACVLTGTQGTVNTSIPAPTDSNGNTSAFISALGLSGYGAAGGATCTYTLPSGGSATVTVNGVDFCTPAGGANPANPPAQCGPRNIELQATPSSLGSGGGNVTLTLRDSFGNAISGAQISGSCDAGAGIGNVIAPTGGLGQTTATINANIAAVCPGTAPNSAACTFSTQVENGASAVVNVIGGFLPASDPSCTTASTNTGTLNLTVTRGGGVSATATAAVTSSPSGFTCNLPASQANAQCNNGTLALGTTLLNVALAGATPAGSVTWGGDCTPVGGNSATVTLAATTASACTMTLNP